MQAALTAAQSAAYRQPSEQKQHEPGKPPMVKLCCNNRERNKPANPLGIGLRGIHKPPGLRVVPRWQMTRMRI